MDAEMMIWFLAMMVVALVALVVYMVVRARHAKEIQRILQASIDRDAMRKRRAESGALLNPRVRAGQARNDDWNYSGSARHHFPPRPLPPRK